MQHACCVPHEDWLNYQGGPAMQTTIQMPQVSACGATECAYNRESKCHALAITVGDRNEPHCDTMVSAPEHVSRKESAGVGACKVSSCRHNQELECNAPAIRVGLKADSVDCLTFEAR
jgi:hypothetical protein